MGRDGSGDGMRPEVIQGDVREVLKTLDDESVQCVVTSPPYWGLRDYGVDDQLGLEATPEEFVENMVDVFREVKRVLRNDGTLWLNLGDSYAGSNGSRGITENTPSVKKGDKVLLKRIEGRNFTEHKEGGMPIVSPDSIGLKHKDLVGIPWRVALALQADGWYLRSDIIWNKPNPMPEPVKDRPTKAHEYIFLLTKSPKYYYDYEAIKEKGEYPAGTRAAKASDARSSMGFVNSRPPEYKIYDGTRNKRSVWKITTKPYKEAHFATFPEELPETCIKAGTSKAGCCADCGSPVKRVTERQVGDDMSWAGRGPKNEALRATGKGDTRGTTMNIGSKEDYYKNQPRNVTLGWEPTCDCNAERVPCVVLDIFAGSGTTLRVASKLGRKGIGIELNPEYIKILKKRCKIESESLEAFVKN